MGTFFFSEEKIPDLDIHIMNQRTSYTNSPQPGFYLAQAISVLGTLKVTKINTSTAINQALKQKRQKPHANRPSNQHVRKVILSSVESGTVLKEE